MPKVACLCILLLCIATIANAKPSKFIATSCKATTDPYLCTRTLSVFESKIQQSPMQLTQIALAFSLSTARIANTYVSKLAKQKGLTSKEYDALHDCMEEMSDTVYRLKNSYDEMKNIGKSKGKEDFGFHMGNVETWVSAALTDDSTCVDGFDGKALDGKVKDAIRAKCKGVAKVTSNALALVNRYASRH